VLIVLILFKSTTKKIRLVDIFVVVLVYVRARACTTCCCPEPAMGQSLCVASLPLGSSEKSQGRGGQR